jgi:two-component system nitrogen regulation response regulator GlnG
MKEEATEIMVVDDDPGVRWALKELLTRSGFEFLEACDGESAVEILRLRTPDLILLDIRMPGMSGEKTLHRIRALDGRIPVIIVTGHGTIRDAVQRVKDGAYDYLTKPFDNEEVLLTIRRGLREHQLKKKRLKTTGNDSSEASLFTLMGRSEEVCQIRDEVMLVSPTDFSVLITGETGVGKEIVARAIHQNSGRRKDGFVAVDCGAIPETLFEKEFFGHQKGSFTGADQTVPGMYEAADKGSLFLDEIANMPIAMQGKLLRVLQEKRFSRIGDTSLITADVRIVAATNLDYAAMKERGFRDDLYHRLSEYVISIPPLRKRQDDILYLAKRFSDLANDELGKRVKGFTEEAVELLIDNLWPGNVRELRNVIRRAILVAEEEIKPEDLGQVASALKTKNGSSGPAESVDILSLKAIVKKNSEIIEKDVLKKTLRSTGGNKAAAARTLQVDYKTLLTKLKHYEL